MSRSWVISMPRARRCCIASGGRVGIYQHSLPLEDARAQAAYGQHSQVGKILEIHQELPGRIHIVLIRQRVGF